MYSSQGVSNGANYLDYQLLNADINQITNNLYLGDKVCAKNREMLDQLGIKHIVVAGEQLTMHYPQKFNYLHLKVKDSPREKIQLHFEAVFSFIDEAIRKKQGVLVHCAYGVSRSATLVIAFLMRKLKIEYLEALRYVRKKRPVISPNQGFSQQLKSWEVTRDITSK